MINFETCQNVPELGGADVKEVGQDVEVLKLGGTWR